MNRVNHDSLSVFPVDIWRSPPSGLSGQQSLEAQLLACIRSKVDPLTAEIIEGLCDRPLNWSSVLHLASRNDVSGLLYQSLQETCPERVPTNVFNTLRHQQQAHWLKSCFLSDELLQLLQALTDAGIPALAYKGPALAMSVYGNLALRPFCDIDILIRPEDLVAAKVVLMESGYNTLIVDDRIEALNIWSDSARDFIRQDGQVVVDLQWRLTPRFFATDLSVDDLLHRHQTVSLMDTPVPVLALEDLMLALCIHGAKECWSKLKWVSDVAQVLQRYPQLNWNDILQRARCIHAHRMVLLGMAMAKELLGAQIPEFVDVLIQSDRTLPMLMQQACTYMFGRQSNAIHRPSPTQFRIRVCDRPIDAVQYVVWRVLVPNVRDRQHVTLPRSLSWLYYFIRPLRLLAETLGWVTRPDLNTPGQQGRSPTTPPLFHPPIHQELDTYCPKTRSDIEKYRLGSDCILYCADQELGIVLNAAAAAIFECCDGHHTLADITTQVAQSFNSPPDALLNDVYSTLLEFQQLNLLKDT